MLIGQQAKVVQLLMNIIKFIAMAALVLALPSAAGAQQAAPAAVNSGVSFQFIDHWDRSE